MDQAVTVMLAYPPRPERLANNLTFSEAVMDVNGPATTQVLRLALRWAVLGGVKQKMIHTTPRFS